jgi:SPP1 family predicted phage head-tail adaptor
MNAGELDTRITIQRRQSGRDSVGQPVETWTDVCTCWASVKFPTGLETIRAGAQTATTRASIRIRYRTGIDASMRMLIGAVVYRIVQPPLGTHRGGWQDIVGEAINV